MQNLSQNKLMQIKKMQNLSQNELEQITKMRHIKTYKKMSKEELLIALLNSKQRHAKLYKSKSNNAEIEETKKLFNEIRNKLSISAIKEIRKDLYEEEKGLENEEKRARRQHAKKLKMIKKPFERFREKIKINYYKPIKTKGAFNDNYIEYAKETKIKFYHLKIILI